MTEGVEGAALAGEGEALIGVDNKSEEGRSGCDEGSGRLGEVMNFVSRNEEERVEAGSAKGKEDEVEEDDEEAKEDEDDEEAEEGDDESGIGEDVDEEDDEEEEDAEAEEEGS